MHFDRINRIERGSRRNDEDVGGAKRNPLELFGVEQDNLEE
jgi:hypothetical protein